MPDATFSFSVVMCICLLPCDRAKGTGWDKQPRLSNETQVEAGDKSSYNMIDVIAAMVRECVYISPCLQSA